MGVYSAIYRGEWGCTVLFIGVSGGVQCYL